MPFDVQTVETKVNDSRLLVAALKRALRARAINYAQVASALNLSEATIKRQFSRGGFTLERFQAICALADTSVQALAQSQEWHQCSAYQLSIEHERMIVRDRRLLLVAMCALSNFTVDAIIDRYQVTRPETIRLLLKLDQMGFLELLPENRIRLRVAPSFEWLPNGPVRQFLCAQMKSDYFGGQFDRSGESLLVFHGDFSDGTHGRLIEKLKQTVTEYSAATRHRKRTPPYAGAPQTLIVSVRPWEMEEFRALRRPTTPTNSTCTSTVQVA